MYFLPKLSFTLKFIFFLTVQVFFLTTTNAQTIQSISRKICDSISVANCGNEEACRQAQRSIYNDEMLKYPTLVVDITDLNKPHQYNEFNYKVNRDLLQNCSAFYDQFSLLPLSKILDVEGLFNKAQYDSLERLLIEYIHFQKTDILVVSIDDYFPEKSLEEFAQNKITKWNVGKRYQGGGILFIVSKRNGELMVKSSKKDDPEGEVELNHLIMEKAIPHFDQEEYFKAIYSSILFLRDMKP